MCSKQKKNNMENTTPVPNNTPDQKAPVQNKDVNTHVNKNDTPAQAVGGDNNDNATNNVVKEDKDVTAVTATA
jgi:hypothetical protein